MNTHETYVSLETAKLLKQAGFDWECIRYYQNNDDTLLGPLVEQYKLVCTNFNVAPIYMDQYSAPTLDVAQRWLREEKGLFATVDYFSDSWREHGYPFFEWKVRSEILGPLACITGQRQTYEEALEAGIKKCLEIFLEKGE